MLLFHSGIHTSHRPGSNLAGGRPKKAKVLPFLNGLSGSLQPPPSHPTPSEHPPSHSSHFGKFARNCRSLRKRPHRMMSLQKKNHEQTGEPHPQPVQPMETARELQPDKVPRERKGTEGAVHGSRSLQEASSCRSWPRTPAPLTRDPSPAHP